MVLPEIETAALCVRPIRDKGFVLDMMAIEPRRRPQTAMCSVLVDEFEAALGQRQASPARQSALAAGNGRRPR